MIHVGASPHDVALFGSDMHLGDHDPATAALFLDALEKAAHDASHLFLLGDLFEAWAGDDQPDAQAFALIHRLATCTARGMQVFVMRGNRDFLLDVPVPVHLAGSAVALQRPLLRFSQRTGAVMLDDPSPITLFGRVVLLAHGDALCTADLEYQRARAMARSADWQDDFLRRPLDERLAIARELRGESRRVQATRAMGGADPGDVDALAVDESLRAARARTMIHGHTHRPACHRWTLDGEPATRWVLPDWHAARNEDDRDRGGFLRVAATGWTTFAV